MRITDFLLARIAEDEAVATSRDSAAPIHYSGCYYYSYSLDANWFCDCDEDGAATARVLAECKAKRLMVGRAEGFGHPSLDGALRSKKDRKYLEIIREEREWDLRVLSHVYQDHPDFDPEWKNHPNMDQEWKI